MYKEKKYKFWIFYLNTEKDFNGVSPGNIYAYTIDSKLAKDFIDSRNMDVFYVKTMKLTKSETNDLYREYTKNQLTEFEGNTRYSDEYKIKKFSIPLTISEKIFIQAQSSVYLHEYIYKHVWLPPEVFKKKIYNSLDMLRYVGLHEFIYNNSMPFDDSFDMVSDDMELILKNFYQVLLK